MSGFLNRLLVTPMVIVIVCALMVYGCAKPTGVVPDQPSADQQAPADPSDQTNTSGDQGLSPAPVVTDPRPPQRYPLNVRVGQEIVDRVIQAVAAKERAQLLGLIKQSKIACSNSTDNLSALPRCGDGVAEGTQIEVFDMVACRPTYAKGPALVERAIDSLIDSDYHVYAVYMDETSITSDMAYVINFAPVDETMNPRGIYIGEDGSIVMIHMGCGLGPERLVPQEPQFVLPPKETVIK